MSAYFVLPYLYLQLAIFVTIPSECYKHVYRFQVLNAKSSIHFSCYLNGTTGQAHGVGEHGKFVEFTTTDFFHVEVDMENESPDRRTVLDRLFNYYENSRSGSELSFSVWMQLEKCFKSGYSVGPSQWRNVESVKLVKHEKLHTRTIMRYGSIVRVNSGHKKHGLKMPSETWTDPNPDVLGTGTLLDRYELSAAITTPNAQIAVYNIRIDSQSASSPIECTGQLHNYANHVEADIKQDSWQDCLLLRVMFQNDREKLRDLIHASWSRIGYLQIFVSKDTGEEPVWKRITVCDIFCDEDSVFGFTFSFRTEKVIFEVELKDTRTSTVKLATTRVGRCSAMVNEFDRELYLPERLQEVDCVGRVITDGVTWKEFFVDKNLTYHTGGSNGHPVTVLAGKIELSFYYDYSTDNFKNDCSKHWGRTIELDGVNQLQAYTESFRLKYCI